jgi:hypothetical protein
MPSQPSLRDLPTFLHWIPKAEALGYCQMSLRDRKIGTRLDSEILVPLPGDVRTPLNRSRYAKRAGSNAGRCMSWRFSGFALRFP